MSIMNIGSLFLGVCFVQDTIPESGSTVIGGEGKSVSFYCRVLNEVNGTQVITEWFIERIDAGGSGPQTIVANPATNFETTAWRAFAQPCIRRTKLPDKPHHPEAIL